MPQERRVLRWDPFIPLDENVMQFRLTYAGLLLAHRDDDKGKMRAPHKHDIRRVFHGQLKALWREHPNLSKWLKPSGGRPPFAERVANNFNEFGYRFLPLITRESGMACKVEVLLLRHGAPGSVVSSGDIDNRIKTLFDALRKPRNGQEVASAPTPSADEDPFYVLLEDDSLITHAVMESDTLLEPVKGDQMDARVVITVTTETYRTTWGNLGM
jgi:hypothetical protein